MVHIKKLNEMVNLELHSEAENKIRDIARTNTDCFEDCGEGMLSISLFNTNFNIPPRMRLYSYEVMVQVYPNDERDVYVVGYKENGENNWWALNQFTQKEQNDIVDAVQASVNKIKEGGMFSENRRTANARGRALNEWGSFGNDTFLDFFGNITGMGEIYKFDKLCPDTELTEDDVEDSLQIFGIDTPLTNISKAYYDAIFKAFVREMQEEYGLSDDEVEDIEMETNPVEFRFGEDYFTTKDEFEKIIDKRRFRK
ncbi:MAG: hypothetical protein IKP45_08455 [Bacteroidales bacterium]|nr:hypothetical protein [Bacteroidales bacterium]